MTLNCSINNQALEDLHSPAWKGLIMFKYYCLPLSRYRLLRLSLLVRPVLCKQKRVWTRALTTWGGLEVSNLLLIKFFSSLIPFTSIFVTLFSCWILSHVLLFSVHCQEGFKWYFSNLKYVPAENRMFCYF